MCLTQVDPKPTRKWGVGYKLLKKRSGRYYCYDHTDDAGKVEYPIGEWITDPKEGMANIIGYKTSYPTGFHIAIRKKPLEQFVRTGIPIVKVKFRQVVATSSYNDSCYGPQVVARQVCNLGEV